MEYEIDSCSLHLACSCWYKTVIISTMYVKFCNDIKFSLLQKISFRQNKSVKNSFHSVLIDLGCCKCYTERVIPQVWPFNMFKPVRNQDLKMAPLYLFFHCLVYSYLHNNLLIIK